jgi:hypothetical protein
MNRNLENSLSFFALRLARSSTIINMATIDVANNMSFFPTSYSADGQAAAGSYGNYPASSNYMQSSSSGSSYQTGFEDEPPLLEGNFGRFRYSIKNLLRLHIKTHVVCVINFV